MQVLADVRTHQLGVLRSIYALEGAAVPYSSRRCITRGL